MFARVLLVFKFAPFAPFSPEFMSFKFALLAFKIVLFVVLFGFKFSSFAPFSVVFYLYNLSSLIFRHLQSLCHVADFAHFCALLKGPIAP